MQIIDLSHTIANSTPVYPGDPSVNIVIAGSFSKQGCLDHIITMGSHTGTHIDAPAHMIEGGKELKDYPIERFVTKSVCIDARNGFNVEPIRSSKVPEGGSVIFYTGISEIYLKEEYWNDYIVLDEDCCQALIDKKISMVGLDTASADNVDGFPIHKKLLGADILIIENLTNLKSLVGKTFELQALPIKLEKDGAPVRAIARVAE